MLLFIEIYTKLPRVHPESFYRDPDIRAGRGAVKLHGPLLGRTGLRDIVETVVGGQYVRRTNAVARRKKEIGLSRHVAPG